MNRWRPIVTLLAGLAVAAVVLGLSYRATVDNAAPAAAEQASASAQPPATASAEPPPPAEASPTPSADDRETPPPAPPLNVTWAGRVRGAGTLAISAKGDKAIAYLCDGRRIEAWLSGTAKAGELNLSGKGGARLTGTFGNGRANGTVTVNARAFDFDVAAVRKPSGLYRASADVRGARIVGGWIQLPGGEQVGLATVDGTLVTPSRLDTGTGAATVGGVPVTAAPAAEELR